MKEVKDMTLKEVLDQNPDLPIEHRRMARKDKLDHGKPRCTCGFRIRGKHHMEGEHHQRKKNRG
jgi:hypothetical protein